MKSLFNYIIEEHLGNGQKLRAYNPVGGGCINSCYKLDTGEKQYFLKFNQSQYSDMFEKEFDGLQALQGHTTLTIPEPVVCGTFERYSFLLMEFLSSTAPSGDYWNQLGIGLAQLHQNSHESYGWSTDNYIGRLPQANTWNNDWVEFFWEHRLLPQINKAEESNLLPANIRKMFDALAQRLSGLLPKEKAGLLHGDLWSGNVMAGPQGQPCIMDPAVYYGHREIELAFTTLFGGFDKKFYQSYHEVYQLAPDYEQRIPLYNLYPLLVHLNLFGLGYLGSIKMNLELYQ